VWVRDALARYRGGGDGAAPAADPRVARAALARFQDFVAGEGSDSLLLRGTEVTSALQYEVPEFLPPGLGDPRVRFQDGAAVLTVSVALSAFPRFPELEGILEILPDTVPLELRGGLEPLNDQEVALRIDAVEASRIPVPRRLYPQILEALGREDRPGLAADAVAVRLPRGVASAYIADDRLVLTGPRSPPP
jgi:hypothetical protein